MHRGILAVLALSGLVLALQSPTKAKTERMGSAKGSSLSLSSDRTTAQTHSTWSDYAGASDASQYSALAQINSSNVSKLQIAWRYPTGDGNKYLFNPIVVDRTMYVLAHNNSIVALEASSGKERWIHPTN